MSLPSFDQQASLFSTAALSGQLFAPEDRFAIFARVLYPLLAAARARLAAAYCPDNGRPAIEPVLLMGVSLLQFLEGVPDRQAVELLRYHAGWNFALNRSIGDEGFDPSVLVYFRRRMVERDLSAVVFASLLEGLVQAGLVERRGKRRLDSTQMMGLLSWMSRLENVRETLRLALQELEPSAGAWPRPDFWPLLMERYVESKLDYRASVETLKSKMDQAGADALCLLNWLESLSDQSPKKGRQAQLLARVFQENFQVQDKVALQLPAQPAGAVQNPHEPEAQWSAKGHGKQKKEHIGYKVQVAETVQEKPVAPGEPTRSFLTAVLTQPATASDEAGLEAVEKEQAALGLEKPEEWYVDGAYVSAQKLTEAHAEKRDLIGPAPSSPKREQRFGSEDFRINIGERRAICPGSHASANCSRLEEEKRAMVNYRFEWTKKLCGACPLRERCLGQNQKHRTLVVGQYHDALQARRLEQKTDAFKEKAKRRNAIEGTQSELVRAHGLRHARYRGQAKVRLQNYLIGAACNAKRWIKRIQWELKQAARSATMTFQSA
jgi:transposase